MFTAHFVQQHSGAQYVLNGGVVQPCRDALTFELTDAAYFGAKALDFAAPPGFAANVSCQADNVFCRAIRRSGEHFCLQRSFLQSP